MWPYYAKLDPDGRLTPQLWAEHVALTLFAVHQQSLPTPAHHKGTGIGDAVCALWGSGKFSPAAVDRRFAAAATATSLDEVAHHLRGLVRQLRQITQGSFDYTRLWEDLVDWQDPEQVGGVRRRWGAQYFLGRDRGDTGGAAPASADTPAS
jgi:CRISPR system Cascade subunit CasB